MRHTDRNCNEYALYEKNHPFKKTFETTENCVSTARNGSDSQHLWAIGDVRAGQRLCGRHAQRAGGLRNFQTPCRDAELDGRENARSGAHARRLFGAWRARANIETWPRPET